MSDSITGIKISTPTYPVRPTEPVSREDRSGKGRQDKNRPGNDDEADSGEMGDAKGNSDDENDKPTIDEYI